MKQKNTITNIWEMLKESFDEKLPRRTAVLVKEEDFSLPFAYPTDFGKIGWLLDNRKKTTYDESPVATLTFGEYSFPDLSGKCLAKNTFYFQKMEYAPSLVRREVVFSNIGIEVKEIFAQNPNGGFTWKLGIVCRNHPCATFEKRLYSIVSLCGKGRVAYLRPRHVLEIDLGSGMRLFIASRFTRYGVYDTVDDYLRDLEKGVLSSRRKEGKYLILEHLVTLNREEERQIIFGISFQSSKKAADALTETKLEQKIERKWNRWFFSLPLLPLASDMEKQAYYKCWWVVRLNYYKHPSWGKTVIEALPVYRGYWQWSLPAVQWHTSFNPEVGFSFMKKLIDLFLKYQRSDGYVTHAIYLDEETPGEKWARSNTVQTPHIPWVALRYYYLTRDKASLQRWYPKLKFYYHYLNQSRDAGFFKLHLWAILNSFDTGLDTTAAFQKVTYGENGKKEKFCYPSIFAAERCRYEIAMAKIAEILGDREAGQWYRESLLTKEAMDTVLWDRKKHWYGVLHENRSLDTRVGVDGLFPLAYAIVDKSRATLMKKHFTRLLGDYGVHTVAPGEPGYYEKIYWRGPAWSKSCSVAMAAALHYYPGFLTRIREGMTRQILRYPSVWECMSAIDGNIARDDAGLMATPCISSTVGAGEAIGAFFVSYGIDMFSLEEP